MSLDVVAPNLPAMFRRAAIHAALGAARSFSTSLRKWHTRKEQFAAKKKRFGERPPVPPRTWNCSPVLYAGQWKERMPHTILLKLWTGTCWSWLKVRLLSRELPEGYMVGSPSLVRHGEHWCLHTPVEKTFTAPRKAEEQVKAQETRLCAIDLNMDRHLAVCTIQDTKGTILATTFIGHGKRIHGLRKRYLGRIARNRRKTGLIAEGEQDNVALWNKIRDMDEHLSHLVSQRIVQFAQEHNVSLLVFEHLGNLRPDKQKYSRMGNQKRAYWMKGRIFRYAKYKAYPEGIITCRVSPRNTSRECQQCHARIARYNAPNPPVGYTQGASLAYCPDCQMKDHADRNASGVIGQRLLARYQKKPHQEKPSTPLLPCVRERDE